jgi:hypothetical protein
MERLGGRPNAATVVHRANIGPRLAREPWFVEPGTRLGQRDRGQRQQ